MVVPVKICCRCDGPIVGKSGTNVTTDQGIVVEIPYRCLMRAGSVKNVVRMAVVVKIAYCSPSYTSHRF